MNSKSVFSKNLYYYMTTNGKNRRDLSRDLGFSYSSVTEWVNGKKYPRMDKVEALANYFGINKSDLIEEKITIEDDEKQDFIVDVFARLYSDEEFYSYMEDIMKLEPEKIQALKQMLASFKILK